MRNIVYAKMIKTILPRRNDCMNKKLFWILVLTCMTVFMAGSAFAAHVSIATGGVAGVYYPVGGAIATAASRHPNIQATAETANASVANERLIAAEEIEIAFAQADVTSWAYNGEMMFEADGALRNIRLMAALYA